MTKPTHDLLRDLLDQFTVTPVYTAACARCGISIKLFGATSGLPKTRMTPTATA